MGRKATRPRYYSSRKGYYVCYQGKQHCLANGQICDLCEQRERDGGVPKCPPCADVRYRADLRFAEIVHLAVADQAEDNALIFAVCNRYLKWLEQHRKERTGELAAYYLGKFCDECGHLKLKQLKPVHVDDWLGKMGQQREVDTPRGKRTRGWGRTCRRQAVTIITTCFNWAKKKQLISKNPIAGGVVDRPPPVHRNKDSLITADEHRRMVDASEYQPRYYPSKGGYCLWAKGACAMLAKGPQADPAVLALANARMDGVKKELGVIEPFAFLLRVLSHTGARPGELLNATAADWNPRLGAFVHEAKDEPEKERGFTHKTARKGKDRFVFVSDPELRDAIEKLRLEYPEGPIFRNLYRRPWSASAVCARFDALKKKLGLNPHITCYSYRHTSITNMMLKGLSWGLIAETHGTSIEMLSKYYGHLDGHAGAMADFWAMAKATPAPGSGGSAGDPPGVSESR